MNENSLGLFNPVDKMCHKISKMVAIAFIVLYNL